MPLCSKGHRYTGTHCPHCQRTGASRPELNTAAWQRLRQAIRHRDGNRCRVCTTDQHLEVHHIERGAGNDPSNLVTLCSRCHHWAEQGHIKLTNTEFTLDDFFWKPPPHPAPVPRKR